MSTIFFHRGDKVLGSFRIQGIPSFCGGYILSHFSHLSKERLTDDDAKAFRLCLMAGNVEEMPEGYSLFERQVLQYESPIEVARKCGSRTDAFYLFKVYPIPSTSHLVFSDNMNRRTRGAFAPAFLCQEKFGYDESRHDINPNSNNEVAVFVLRRKLGAKDRLSPITKIYHRDWMGKMLGEPQEDYVNKALP
jgi:hypothetical protein